MTTGTQVKILDFGLAKKVSGGRGGAETEVATASIDFEHLTSPGMAMGTAAYMSREQALGEPLDARTDLFSFGAILYEMATGRRPFGGSSFAAILDELLHKAPAAPVRLNPAIPPKLEEIINKLLEKDREARYQSAKDVLLELRRLKRDGYSGNVAQFPQADGRESDLTPSGNRKKLRHLFAAGGGIGLSAVATLMYWLTRPSFPPRVVGSTPITRDGGPKTGPLLTDGSRLYFNVGSPWAVYQVSTSGFDAVPMSTSLSSIRLLDISPDKTELLVAERTSLHLGRLWILPTLGGSPRPVGDLPMPLTPSSLRAALDHCLQPPS